MLEGYRIVPFIPSGRKRVQSILIDNLRRFSVVDEVQIWVNVEQDGSQAEDEAWLRSLPDQWSKCKVYELPAGLEPRKPKQLNTGRCYAYTQESKTIYFRFDDDIIFIDDHYFENMVACRLEDLNPPVVFGNIWNNALCSYLHQQAGHVDRNHGIVESAFCMDPVGWQSAPFAEYIHRVLLKHIADDTVPSLYLDNYVLNKTRFSVSNFCFTGDRMQEMHPGPFDEEENWLSEVYPQKVGIPNIVCGDALVSHYSFFAQRDHLNTTDILDQYRRIAQERLSRDYYKMLDEHVEAECAS